MNKEVSSLAKNIAVTLLFGLSIASAQLTPTAPPQPLQGPGGTDYLYQSYSRQGPFYPAGYEGQGQYLYYIYQPESPRPVSAPVVLFLHGIGALQPAYYDGWLEQLAQKGFTVVFPQYQLYTSLWTQYPQYAQAAWVDALSRMSANTTGQFVIPQKDSAGKYRTATIGHSVGGFLAATMAGLATVSGSPMPVPLALMIVSPSPGNTPFARFGNLPSTTKLIMVVGEDDTTVCTSGVDYLWPKMSQITQKNFLVATTDTYGAPELIADHAFPTAYQDPLGVQTNSQDFYGTFKLSVSLLSCAFNGTNCNIAFGNGSQEQVDQGLWSDGKPINDWRWYSDPSKAVLNCKDSAKF